MWERLKSAYQSQTPIVVSGWLMKRFYWLEPLSEWSTLIFHLFSIQLSADHALFRWLWVGISQIFFPSDWNSCIKPLFPKGLFSDLARAKWCLLPNMEFRPHSLRFCLIIIEKHHCCALSAWRRGQYKSGELS